MRWAVLFAALSVLVAACTNGSGTGTAAKPRKQTGTSAPTKQDGTGQVVAGNSNGDGDAIGAPPTRTTAIVNGQPLTGRQLLQATRARFTRPLPTVVPAGTTPTTTAPVTTPTTQPGGDGGTVKPPNLQDDRPSQEIIAADYHAGKITYSQYVLYRAYALFWDPRLPAAYDGIGSSGEDDLFTEASQHFGLLDADTQAKLAPFLERPASPQGYGCPLTDNGQSVSWIDSGTASTHFKVWSCATNGGADDINTVVGILDGLYPEMADPAGMGPPVPDSGTADDGGDPRIDVYLLDTVPSRERAGRQQAIDGATIAAAAPDGPFVGSTASSYLMIGRPRLGDHDGIRRALIHQFFHSLEYAHNYAIKTVDPGQTPWFFEAAAAWAEATFFPAGSAGVHGDYFGAGFRNAPDLALEIPFAATGSTAQQLHPYWAYLWPFFMQQEAGGDPNAVADTWSAVEGASDWNAFHAAIDAQLPYATSFRDFAVRNLNLDLGPAFEPHYRELDPNFPDDIGPPLVADLDVTAPGTATVQLGGGGGHGLAPLSAQYDRVTISDPQTTVLSIDFTGIGSDADITVMTQSSDTGEWTRRDLVPGDRLELPFSGHDGPVAATYVIIDNHQREPDWSKPGGGVVTGSYTVTTED
ncbi:MAG: hypothetical protein QOE35_2043 [Actinomycetota bacterium]